MKIEISIPQVEPLIVAIHQLIDTLNDVAVAQISASCHQIESAQADEKPKAKRGSKAAESEPEPQPEPEQVPTAEAVAALEELKTPAPEPIVINTAIEPEPVEAPQTRDPLTLDQIKAHSIPLQQAGKLPEAKAWLAEHGAAALKDLAPEHYDAFDAWAKAQLA